VEGFVTVVGAVATGVRIHFRYNDGKYDWYAGTDDNGFYRVTFDGRTAGSFCIFPARAVPHNSFFIFNDSCAHARIYVGPDVLLKFGARSTDEPSEQRSIRCDAAASA
jgi:hypothetical protein